jgi:hypothetical protein
MSDVSVMLSKVTRAEFFAQPRLSARGCDFYGAVNQSFAVGGERSYVQFNIRCENHNPKKDSNTA